MIMNSIVKYISYLNNSKSFMLSETICSKTISLKIIQILWGTYVISKGA